MVQPSPPLSQPHPLAAPNQHGRVCRASRARRAHVQVADSHRRGTARVSREVARPWHGTRDAGIPAPPVRFLMGAVFADATQRDIMPGRFPSSEAQALRQYVDLFLAGIGATARRPRKRAIPRDSDMAHKQDDILRPSGPGSGFLAAAAHSPHVRLAVAPSAYRVQASAQALRRRCRGILTVGRTGRRRAAGPAQPQMLTLDDALALAEKTSEQLTIAEAGVTRADSTERRVRSEWLPQVSALASYDRALRPSSKACSMRLGTPCTPFTVNPQAPLTDRVVRSNVHCATARRPETFLAAKPTAASATTSRCPSVGRTPIV